MPRKWVFVLILGISLNLFLPLAALGQTYVLDRPSTGQVLELEPGDIVEIVLSSNPSTGFSWIKASEDNSAVLTQENHWLEEKGAMPGAAGSEHWVFKAAGQGKTQIDLWYARPWESRMPEQRLTFDVNVAVEEIAGYQGSIWVNSREIGFSDKPIVKGGRVMVELKQLASALGSTVTTEGALVKLNNGERAIVIDCGKGAIQIDGINHQLPFYSSGEKAMVPIRAIAEGLGYQIEWRAEDQAIVINSRD